MRAIDVNETEKSFNASVCADCGIRTE